MKKTVLAFFILVGVINTHLNAQDSLQQRSPVIIPASRADSNYIKTYSRCNDIRIIFGRQGSGLSFQSFRDDGVEWVSEDYNNINNLIGIGLTYKFLDFDLVYSLPTANTLQENQQNLHQYKLSTSYTTRKNVFRAYITESTGVISVDPVVDYESDPDINLFRIVGQVTHVFNSLRYSYAAANYQNELQSKTAGSFLLRLEMFYRKLGVNGTSLAPTTRNIQDIFGDQAGLIYIYAPGLLLLPGYSINVVSEGGKYYFSPMILAGAGIALNTYKSDLGKYTKLNGEYYGALSINTGYNGTKLYCNFKISYEANYSNLSPSFLTATDIKGVFTVGYRFWHLENKIPTSF